MRPQRKLLIGLGLGCAVVLLVVGVAAAVGLFRTVTCASNVVKTDIAEAEVNTVLYEFALALHHGDVETAYGMLGETARHRHTPETLRAEFQEYEQQLAWSIPFPVERQRVRREEPDEVRGVFDLFYAPEDADWKGSTYFRSSHSGEELSLSISLDLEADGFEYQAAIVDWTWESRTEDLAADRVLNRAATIIEHLLNREWESAGSYLHPASALATGEHQTAGQRLKELMPEFPTHARVHQLDIRPLDSHSMMVDLTLRGPHAIQELSFKMGHQRQGLMEIQVGELRSAEPITRPDTEMSHLTPGDWCEGDGLQWVTSGERLLVASQGSDDTPASLCVFGLQGHRPSMMFQHSLAEEEAQRVSLATGNQVILVGYFSEAMGPLARADVLQPDQRRGWSATDRLTDPDSDEDGRWGFGSLLTFSGNRILVAVEEPGPEGAEVVEFGGRRERFAKTGRRLVIGEGGHNVIALAADDSRAVASTGERIYVWRRNTLGDWEPPQALESPATQGDSTEQCFGFRLALQEDLLAASHCDDESETSVVLLYGWDGEGFAFLDTLTSPGGDGDEFGDSLAWVDSSLLVGAPRHGDGVGRVWEFLRPNENPTAAYFLDPEGDEPGEFGRLLSVGSSRVLIGAPNQNRVYFYQK